MMIADENGSLYCDAVDLITLNKKYTETDIVIEEEEASNCNVSTFLSVKGSTALRL